MVLQLYTPSYTLLLTDTQGNAFSVALRERERGADAKVYLPPARDLNTALPPLSNKGTQPLYTWYYYAIPRLLLHTILAEQER